MQATLGGFVFDMSTASFEQFKRITRFRWASNNRVGNRASKQSLGPGEDIIQLNGRLYPAITGGRMNLDALRILGDAGVSYPFIDGEGFIYGLWYIDSVDETRKHMHRNGAPKRIDFNLSIVRSDDTKIDQISAIARAGLSLL